jgi:hypothetical protein
MNQRQLASVLFTAIGIYLAAQYVPIIPVQFAALTPLVPDSMDPAPSSREHRLYILSFISSAVTILICVGLIAWRNRLADRLFPPANQSLGSTEVQAVALSVLGCYFAVLGISGLADWGFRWAPALQLVLGAGLFLGARGLSRIWSFGRSVGVSRGGQVP